MNKIAAVAFTFAAAAFAAEAQTTIPAPLQAVSTTGSQARIVPIDGSQDGDMTLEGFEGVACEYLYSEELVSVGPIFGDDEKDTVARTVVGTDCR
jgi:hypothetical protein